MKKVFRFLRVLALIALAIAGIAGMAWLAIWAADGWLFGGHHVI